jgi:hypothetical protein
MLQPPVPMEVPTSLTDETPARSSTFFNMVHLHSLSMVITPLRIPVVLLPPGALVTTVSIPEALTVSSRSGMSSGATHSSGTLLS